jgi:hypothetical protein
MEVESMKDSQRISSTFLLCSYLLLAYFSNWLHLGGPNFAATSMRVILLNQSKLIGVPYSSAKQTLFSDQLSIPLLNGIGQVSCFHVYQINLMIHVDKEGTIANISRRSKTKE